MSREEYIQGLRDIADFFEARPDLPTPSFGESIFIWERSLENARERGIQMAPCEKEHTDNYFHLVRKFGPHTLKVTWGRDDVCERVQVGTKHVPEEVIPAHDEPIYEWDCTKPILGSSSDKQLNQGDQL
jgi:hypothetical protein